MVFGSTGCWVFKRGVQNWNEFCLKINIPQKNYWILRIGTMGRCQKVLLDIFSKILQFGEIPILSSISLKSGFPQIVEFLKIVTSNHITWVYPWTIFTTQQLFCQITDRGWIFWTMIFYNLNKFTSRSI